MSAFQDTLSDNALAPSLILLHRAEKHIVRKSYSVVLQKGQDGWIVVRCPELQVVTQGKDEQEALRNAIEAIDLMLEELGRDKEFNLIVIRKNGV